MLRLCIHALAGLAGDTVGGTTAGGQQISLPKGRGLPPGAAATGHIEAMAVYAGGALADILAVEPVATVIQSWRAAAQRPS